MNNYFYCPVLKTRPAEINAYEILNDEVKNNILPIIEMTGALSYTYPKTYKKIELRHTKRAGDINSKIKKIYNLMQGRKFILDITDDKALMYDGLSDAGGLLDSTNGYEKWINFLTQHEGFKKAVIPTIQLDTTKSRDDIIKQIKTLDETFECISLKLPALVADDDLFSSTTKFNVEIVPILEFLETCMPLTKLILILDFGYIKCHEQLKAIIGSDIESLKKLPKLKAIIPISSSFPNFVTSVPHPISTTENNISQLVRRNLVENIAIHGDFSSIHPVKYEMGGGGWIPRIDYIIRNSAGMPVGYAYERGSKKNTSSEYPKLARQVLSSSNYKPISQFEAKGDTRILEKANDGAEGKAPAYWIAVRSNIYMTAQFIYLKNSDSSCLFL